MPGAKEEKNLTPGTTPSRRRKQEGEDAADIPANPVAYDGIHDRFRFFEPILKTDLTGF